MPKEGLPKQGAEALMQSWDDANEMIVKQKKDKEQRKKENKEFRKALKGK